MSLLAQQSKEGRLHYDLYLAVYNEWLKFMIHCGPYVGLGFRDMTAKLNTMTDNKKLLKKLELVKTQKTLYITDFCLEEIKLGLSKFNQEDNKKHFEKACKRARSKITRSMEDDLKDYISTVRTVQRG